MIKREDFGGSSVEGAEKEKNFKAIKGKKVGEILQ